MLNGLNILKISAIGLSIMILGVVSGQKIALEQATKLVDKEYIITQASVDYFRYLKGINMINVDEVTANIEKYYIVDLRRANDYEMGHIPGAVNIIMPDIGKAIPTFPKDKPIIFVCYSGEWAAQTAGVLRMAGFDARVLTGGYESWLKACYQIEE